MSYPGSEDGARPTALEAGGFPFAIVVGAALIVIGLGLVVFGVSMRDDSPVFVLGAAVFGAGVLRLTTALSSAAMRRRAYLADPNDPRWYGGAGIPQLAGRSCAECRRKIVIGSDAVRCEACGAATHIDCEARHHAVFHDDQESAALLR